jgi:hypothetical protein
LSFLTAKKSRPEEPVFLKGIYFARLVRDLSQVVSVQCLILAARVRSKAGNVKSGANQGVLDPVFLQSVRFLSVGVFPSTLHINLQFFTFSSRANNIQSKYVYIHCVYAYRTALITCGTCAQLFINFSTYM